MTMALPAELSITHLAELLGLERHVVEHRVEQGTIPSYKVGLGKNSKRVVNLETLRVRFPDLYEAVVMRSDALDEDDD